MVSHSYDAKLDAISRKIDELNQKISQLGHEPTRNTASININQEERCTSLSLTPASSLVSTPDPSTLPYNLTDRNSREGHDEHPQGEHEGESSLFAHAVFASRFLQSAIDNTNNADFAREMKAALDGLKSAAHSGKTQFDALDKLYPQAKAIAPGSTARNLPLPPMDKVFMCLRMARECPQVATLWLGDYITPAHFNDYFIKVASPGPATEADLIIVHCGLYWLFCECSKAITDTVMKQDYGSQALLCEANLQTVLASLHFYQPANMDSVCAMGIASLYCLQKNKPFAAWGFINSAAQMVQALGLQHNTPVSTEGVEQKAHRRNVFWTIYMTEKMMSLRLGRSSTFRDQDITLPRPGIESTSGTFLSELTPGWITMASIQGRIYDDIYSPGALMQPPHIRASRAQTLAAELKTAMQHIEDVHRHYDANKAQMLGLDYHEIARRSDRVISLSMLTLIYRSIISKKPSASAFCQECIDAARETLQEHDRCVAVITKARGKTILLETYINWSIIQSPFIPFIILFCHTIETSQASDLEYMRGFVESLESTSMSRQSTYDKQRRLFRALYDVAVKYIEVKTRANGGQIEMSWADATYGSDLSSYTGVGVGMGLMGGLDMNLEMDVSGMELWSWFSTNQSIMRMLEDI
ncbi:fungal-specific transcription factor domain-containing protein [Aspergillus multicolor]|uniref:putative C6 transcription factor n=1 Tax=Aspergillus multicolor TaxID=41759 RepID=UPI003CCDCFB9